MGVGSVTSGRATMEWGGDSQLDSAHEDQLHRLTEHTLYKARWQPASQLETTYNNLETTPVTLVGVLSTD